MAAHLALCLGLLWQASPPVGRSKASVLENSIFIDPAAFEAVKRARAATVKNKPTPAPKLPAPAPPKPAAVEKKLEPPKPLAGAVIWPAPSAAKKTEPAAEQPAKAVSESKPASAAAAPKKTSPAAASKTGTELLANPKTRGLFTDYFGLVKSRIQEKLREKCQGRNVGRGSVQLAFILGSNGRLHKVYVMDRNSQADAELKELAIESLHESAPFSDFPTDFNARQIAFNLTVYFDDL